MRGPEWGEESKERPPHPSGFRPKNINGSGILIWLHPGDLQGGGLRKPRQGEAGHPFGEAPKSLWKEAKEVERQPNVLQATCACQLSQKGHPLS